jgi:hypothetical protein
LQIIKRLADNEENVVVRHVNGHQDRGISVLNVEADHIATSAMQNTTTMENIQLPSTRATLWINGFRVTSNHTKHLRDAYQGKN